MEQRKIEILKENFGHYYRNGQEHLFRCPKCNHHKRKLSVNISRNVFKCWVCEFSGADIYRLLRRYGSRSAASEWKQFNEVIEISSFDNIFEVDQDVEDPVLDLQLPEGFVTLTGDITRSLQRPYNYLINRGLTKDDINAWKIGCCLSGEYKDRIIIPSFGPSGEMNYYVARTFGSSYMRYKNPPASKDVIFNELMLDWSQPVTLVEGVFDAIKVPNAIPLLGSSLNTKSKVFQDLVRQSESVYIALDRDVYEKSFKIIENLLLYNINVYRVDTSSKEDVGEMSKEEFEHLKNAASFVSLEDYLLHKTTTIWS